MPKRLPLLVLTLLCLRIAGFAQLPDTLPDHTLTPGATDPAVTQETIHKTICVSGYTKTVRNVPKSEKLAVAKAYGIRQSEFKKVEFDHLISIENGGSNVAANIWPQYYEPFPGARDKDKLENNIRARVCAGIMTLAEAQRILSTDWFAEYKKVFGDARVTRKK